MIGALIHITRCTRPDMAFAVYALARSLHAPALRHQNMAKRMLRYIAGTAHLGLYYRSHHALTGSSLRAYVDEDRGGCLETR